MSNLEKARAVANEWVDLMGGLDNISYIYGNDIGLLVQAIHAAGLLAPDLPEPTSFNHRDEPCWETEGNTRVRTPGMLPIGLNGPFREGWDMHSPEARDIALALLAACEYAEKEQGNGAN